MPVSTDTLENSTALKISIFSENNFWMLLIKLLSIVLLRSVKCKGCLQINILQQCCLITTGLGKVGAINRAVSLGSYVLYRPRGEAPVRSRPLFLAKMTKAPPGGITASLLSDPFFIQLTNLWQTKKTKSHPHHHTAFWSKSHMTSAVFLKAWPRVLAWESIAVMSSTTRFMTARTLRGSMVFIQSRVSTLFLSIWHDNHWQPWMVQGASVWASPSSKESRTLHQQKDYSRN